MKARIRYNSWVPKLAKFVGVDAKAMTFASWIWVRAGSASQRLLNHEKIHVEQYSELWVIGFVLVYGLDWIKGIVLHRSLKKAYRSIRLEQEARAGQADIAYLESRRPFSWRDFKVR